MAILIDHKTRLICQGLTNQQGTFHSKQALDYGTQLVGGVTPGRGGSLHLDLPVYDTVTQAMEATGANATVIFLPATCAADAILEAIEAKMPLIICVTQGIPVLDMMRIQRALWSSTSLLIGPSSPGIITPNVCKVGTMPGQIYRPGSVGIISRADTLTYEAVTQITNIGLGQSTCVGIGDDLLHGLDFADCLQMFWQDSQTQSVLLIGYAGGDDEERVAMFLKDRAPPKPVVVFLAGQTAPAQQITGSSLGYTPELFKETGAVIVDSVSTIGQTIRQVMQ